MGEKEEAMGREEDRPRREGLRDPITEPICTMTL